VDFVSIRISIKELSEYANSNNCLVNIWMRGKS